MAQGSEKNVMTRGPTNRTWWKPAAGPAAEQEQPLHAMAHALPESCLDVAVALGATARPTCTLPATPGPLDHDACHVAQCTGAFSSPSPVNNGTVGQL